MSLRSWPVVRLAAAVLLAACGDDPAGGPGPVAALQAVTPAQVTAYAATQNRVYVRAVDADGDPVPGATVQWRVVSGGGSIGAASSVTNLEGIAEVAWTLGTTVGAAAQLEASHANAQAVVFTATAALPPGVAITALGAGQSAVAFTQLAQPVGVRVTLPDGRPLAGVPVRWTGPSVPIDVLPSGPVALQGVTNAQGEAFATWRVPTRAGTYVAFALVGAEPQETRVPVSATAVHGPVAQVNLLASPGGCAVPGGSAGQLWGLLLVDQYNNPVQGERVDFAATADGSVTPATALTDAGGGATTRWVVRSTRVPQDTMFARVPSIGYTNTFLKNMCPG